MKNAVETDINELKRVRIEKLDNLVKEGKDPFEITKFSRTHSSKDISEGYTVEKREVEARGETKIVDAKISPLDGQTVCVAGRIMSKRGMGKVGFCHVADMDGQFQIFVKKDILGDEEYEHFKKNINPCQTRPNNRREKTYKLIL